MKRENEDDSDLGYIVSGILLLIFLICGIFIFFYQASLEQKIEDEQRADLKEAIQLTLTEQVYNLDDTDAPYHFNFSYEIDKESKVFDRQMVYTYESEGILPGDDFFSVLDTDFKLKLYQRIQNENGDFYIPTDKVDGMEDLKVVGVGMSAEDIRKKHPNALIIGEEFPDKGEWHIRGLAKVEKDFDLTGLIDNFIYSSFPFPENEEDLALGEVKQKE